MMQRDKKVEISVGIACGEAGNGVVYAQVRGGAADDVLRVPFACRPRPALQGRDVAYAGLEAVAATLLGRHVRQAKFLVTDRELAADLAGRRAVPQPLAIPYVTLRCRLNRFGRAEVVCAEDQARCRDLEGRARAEVSLDIAA